MTSYMAQVVGALVPREIKLIHLLDIPPVGLQGIQKLPQPSSLLANNKFLIDYF